MKIFDSISFICSYTGEFLFDVIFHYYPPRTHVIYTPRAIIQHVIYAPDTKASSEQQHISYQTSLINVIIR